MPSTSLTPHNNIEIKREQWAQLRDLYKNNWPKHIMTVYTLQNYIAWAEKDPNMRDAKITSVDDKWMEHGSFLLEDNAECGLYIFFDTLEPEHPEILLNTLKVLNPNAGYLMTFAEQARSIAEQHLIDLDMPHFEDKYFPTLLYYMPKEEAINLELSSKAGFKIMPLSDENVEQVNNLWPHHHPGSEYLIRRSLRYNISLGVFNETNGELCGSVLHWSYGTLGILQVEEKYKRMGLAQLLIRHLSVKLAEMGHDTIATVLNENFASCSLFEKMGFKMIDSIYWLMKDAKQIEDSIAPKIG